MSKKSNVIYLILLVLPFIGCSSTVATIMPQTRAPLDEDVQRSSEGMYRFMVGELAVKNDDIPGAIENFTKANQSQINPIPRISQRLALLQYKMGDLDAALRESDQAVAMNPSDYNNWLIRGGILESKLQSEEALKSYSKAASLAAAAHEPVLLKASLLYRLERKAEARETLESFVRENPNSSPVLAMLGRFYEDAGDHDAAEKHLRRSWENSKSDLTVGFDLIRILLGVQKTSEAKVIVQKIIGNNPKELQARRTYAQILYNENNLAGAIEQLKAAVALAADPSEVEYEIALIEIKRNRNQEAVSILAKILGKHSNRSAVRFTLANLYASLKDFNAALAQLAKLSPKDKEYNRGQVLRALLLFQQGHADEAHGIIQALRSKTHTDPQLNDEYLERLELLFISKTPADELS